MKYLVKTLGCKANFADSQSIESELQKLGWSAAQSAPNFSSSDHPVGSETEGVQLCIVNSCTVTNEADRQTRKIAAKLARDNPLAVVAVTGCAAEVNPESFLKAPGVHYIVGNQNKDRIAALLTDKIRHLNGTGNFNHPAAAPGTAEFIDKNSPAEKGPAEILGTVSDYAEMISRHPLDREWPAVDSFKMFDHTEKPAAVESNSETATPAKNSVERAHPDHSQENLPTEKTRAFFKIQEGCNAFCTYCIIPYGRGPSRSLRPGEIITQIQDLIRKGIKEIVLTGTNIGDYGTDLTKFQESQNLDNLKNLSHLGNFPDDSRSLKPNQQEGGSAVTLADLIRLILEKTDLPRLRLSSLDPAELTPEIRDLLAKNPRICPHFHVSLQSPQTRILKLMKRRYGFPEVQDCLTQIGALGQAPGVPFGGIFVGMDLITGFPGETDEEFEEGLAALSNLPWHRLHVFPYSERAGTPATRLPKSVPPQVRALRTKKLMQLSLARLTEFYRGILEHSQTSGVPLENVLLEKRGNSRWIGGYTPNYLRVLLPAESRVNTPRTRNQLITVWPTDLMIDTPSGDVALICTAEQPATKARPVF